MDRHEKNESSERRREELLARRLAAALDQRGGATGAKDCPDADVIAAYAEQALGPDESAQCEDHFAGCPRCRTILRVLTASADTPLAEKEVARLGELMAATRAPTHVTPTTSPSARPRFIDWRMRWLAPALGVAAVVAILLALRPPWRATQTSRPETLVAQAPKQELPLPPAAAEADRLSRAVPPREERPLAASKSESTTALSSSVSSSAPAAAKERAEIQSKPEALAPRAREVEGPSAADKKFSAMQQNAETQPPAVPSSHNSPASGAVPSSQLQAKALPEVPPVGGAQLDAQANAEEPREKQPVAAQDGAASNAEGGAARQQVTAELRSTERNARAFTLARPLQKDSGVLKSPSGSTLWRAGSAGSIERSLDGGKTWVPQASPSQEDWLAGTAISDAVCWLAGRRGTIARTTDGAHWERIAPPPQAAAQRASVADFTGVSATDAESASVTASDGRKFVTADGGKTWRQQPQE